MRDARRGEDLQLSVADALSGAAFQGWRNHAAVVVRRLARNFPGAPLGADVVFASDLPSASGMSSSSALMIGITTALTDLGGVRQRAEWRANIRCDSDAAAYYACIENGMTFGTLTGDAGVGTHGGSEDHLAIVCGRPGALSAWRFVPIQPAGSVPLPHGWSFVIASSGVAADKTGAAKDSYNRLSHDANALLTIWNGRQPPQRSLSAALDSDPAAPLRLREAIAREVRDAASADALTRRLDHFLFEDRRIPQALEAFMHADADAVSALAERSQEDASRLLGNQVPETEALARLARELGSRGASSFGAGFGGSVWALVDTDRAVDFAGEWLARYWNRFPTRTGAVAFAARPGPASSTLQLC
jgi:galactokinase